MQTIETEHLESCQVCGSRKKTKGGTFFSDLQTAVGLFTDMRKARKKGEEVEVRKYKQFPSIQSGGFCNTVEGCVLSWLDRKIVDKVQVAFDELPDDIKYLLQFAPKDGEFIDRAKFWRCLLRSVLTNEESRIAMMRILRWYIHIKHREMELWVPGYDFEEVET